MKETVSTTIRINRDLLKALKIRAVMNDRSANGEISAILKDILDNEKASGQAVGSEPDALDSE